MPIDRKECSALLALSVHEFRSPVSVVSGYLRMLLRGQAGELSEHQREMLEAAERSCNRLTELVSQLNELAKFDMDTVVFQKQRVPVFQLVREAASSVPGVGERGVRLQVQAQDDPIVIGDSNRLKAAFGAVFTATLRDRVQPAVVVADCALRGGKDARMAVITIRDEDGSGGADARGETQHPFDEWRGGMGLALPLARRIIERHGGQIWSLDSDRPVRVAVALPVEAVEAAEELKR